MFCLRICCALPIQVISSSLPIGFCFNSSGYSSPNLSIPSKQSPSRACLEAKEYSCYQFIPAIALLIFSFFPRQYIKKSKIISLFKYAIDNIYHLSIIEKSRNMRLLPASILAVYPFFQLSFHDCNNLF